MEELLLCTMVIGKRCPSYGTIALSRIKQHVCTLFAAALPGFVSVDVALHCPCSEEKGPNVQTASTSTLWGTTQAVWREKFHLCVFDSSQVLKLVVAHNMEYGECPAHGHSCY